MSKKRERTFIDKCLSGDAFLHEIDDWVESWHNTPSELKLHEFLGMIKNEYKLWVKDPDMLSYIIAAKREHADINEFYEEFEAIPIAARSDSKKEVQELMKWLKKKNII